MLQIVQYIEQNILFLLLLLAIEPVWNPNDTPFQLVLFRFILVALTANLYNKEENLPLWKNKIGANEKRKNE